MNWMIYPAAKAFIRACTFLFGAGVTATVLIHLFMPLFLHCPRTAAPFLLFGNMVGTNLHPGPVFPPILGKQGPAGFPGEQDHKNSKRAGLPARPVLPPHSVCGDARLIAIRGNGQGLGVLPPSGGHHFFLFPSLIRRDTDPQAEGHSWPGALRRQAADCKASCSSSPPCCGSACPPWLPPWQRQLRGWPLSCPAASKSCGLSVILVRRLFKNAMSIASMPELMNPSMPDSRP